MKRALTGIRTSGSIHIGNYLGCIKPALELQKNHHCIFFLADMHSLTTGRDPIKLQEQILETTACWMACGLDIEKNILFRSSDVAEVAELAWYFSCLTGMGFLERAHSYKDAKAKNIEINHGIFSYPVLMAADILLYDVDIVPVGKDQKQHVEMARDIAGSFNSTYGNNILKLPDVLIQKDVETIPGIDGRKMSKSYDNVLPLFATEKELRKRIMAIPTDSTALEAPKTLEGASIGLLLKHFMNDADYQDLEGKLQQGGYGWGHVKSDLADRVLEKFADIRTKYFEIRPDLELLKKALSQGEAKAREIAEPKMREIKKAIGISF